jgi:hypothetical protein
MPFSEVVTVRVNQANVTFFKFQISNFTPVAVPRVRFPAATPCIRHFGKGVAHLFGGLENCGAGNTVRNAGTVDSDARGSSQM